MPCAICGPLHIGKCPHQPAIDPTKIKKNFRLADIFGDLIDEKEIVAEVNAMGLKPEQNLILLLALKQLARRIKSLEDRLEKNEKPAVQSDQV